jgi:hypothetical protein
MGSEFSKRNLLIPILESNSTRKLSLVCTFTIPAMKNIK